MRPFSVVALAAAFTVGAAPMAAAATDVGVAAAVNQSAFGTPPGGGQRVIQLGSNLVFNERIVTGEVGLVQILLADGTTFMVGKNSELVIDSFVYDPAAGTAKVVASFAKGAMRFVGGRTSSTPGGVVVKTPIGTIGIRGAIFDARDDAIDVVRADEATLTTESGVLRAESGYSFTEQPDGSVDVEKTEEAYVFDTSGGDGGAGAGEGEAEEGSEAVVADNSAYTPSENDQTPSGSEGPSATGPDATGADEADEATTDASTGTIRDEVAENPPPPPPPAETEIPVRVLIAGATYEELGGDSIADPGSVGLVGGSALADQTVTVTVPENGLTGTGEITQGEFTIPVFDIPGYTVRSVNGTSSFGAMSGTAYTNGDFAAYFFDIGGDPTDPFWVVRADTPTDFVPTFSGDGIRRYGFERDPLQDVAVPFFRADALGNVDDAAITDFYVVEQTDPTQTAARFFQTWVLIDGQGAGQRSGVGVTASGIGTDEDDEYGISGGRRGSYRPDALGTSYIGGGGYETLEGPVGGDEFFGENGENFILGHGLDGANDSFGESAANNDGSGLDPFGTTHVAFLIDETPKGDFTRTDRDLRGFAAAALESWTIAEGPQTPTIVMSDNLDVELGMNATNSNIGGTIAVRDTIDSGSSGLDYLEIAFGAGGPEGGGSALIDDDVYGATHNNDTDRSFIRLDGDPEDKTQLSTNNANTYFVSYDAAPQDDFMGGSSDICECAFLEWGWWGTRVRAREPDAPDPEEEIFRASVHLGTWVAGDVSTHDGIDASSPGLSATYAGHAIGSVINTNTGAQYIAGGSMDMTWNFGPRNGNVTISDFDGMTFGADVTGPLGPGDAVFSGEIDDLFPSLHGTINGAFVNDGSDPAGGVLGNFGVEGANFKAVGTLAGERQ